MPSTSRFRRVTRHAISLTVLGAGALLALSLLQLSPIVLGTSAVGIALTLWWFRRRELLAKGYLRGRYQWRDLLLAGLLVGGLWVGLYLVFSLGDVGFSSGTGTRIPIGLDAASMSVGEMLMAGLAATVCAMALAFPFRGSPKHRRDVRETALVGTGARESTKPTPSKGTGAQ